MSKKFSPAPGVEILFDRRVTVEVKAPKSGRMIEIEDDAPEVLAVHLDDATTYYERRGEFWAEITSEEVIAAAIMEIDNAERSKRAPKF